MTEVSSADAVRVELLADHSELFAPVGRLRWQEWGYGNPNPQHWIDVTIAESGRDTMPITLVAVDPDGEALGAVALGAIDDELSETERAGRSPWLLGMVVRPARREQGIGRLLVSALEDLTRGLGHGRVWVATGVEADGFYRTCGWVDEQHLVLASTGIATTILCRAVAR